MKEIKILKIPVFFLLIIISVNAFGQTTNKGILYVSTGTEFSTVKDLDNTEEGEFLNDGEVFIYRNFNNDGIVDFYGNTGLTRFIGNAPQEISGSKDSYLYNVYFDNISEEAPFHLSGMLNVGGLVDFYEGIVDNDTYGGSFTFANEADHVNTSDFSHVDGLVYKLGNTAFTYPIGDGGYYRFAGISDPLSQNTYRAKYYLENSDMDYPHELRPDIITHIDNKEYWTIEPLGEVEDIMITLSWREVTTPEEIIEEPQEENIHIVRWDEETNMWIDEGGVVNTDEQTVTTAVSKYGIFTLARVKSDDILPCQVVVYNAVTPNGDGVNDYFRIDKSNSTCAKNLNVQIFNRWGVKVFETNNYGVDGDLFRGYSEGRATLNKNGQLPTGTYFYVLDYEYEVDNGTDRHKEAGYLYLNGN